MFTIPTRTLALLGATAATGLAVAGCGSTGHGGHGAAGTTTATAARAATSVDDAFVAQMVPHHQMAVQMARDAPARATHAEIRTLANAIITSQSEEITRMRAAARRLGVRVAAMPMTGAAADTSGVDTGHAMHGATGMAGDAKTLGLSTDDMGMSMDMTALAKARPFDRAFIDEMIPHHQGAIRMARAELAKGTDPELKQLATGIVAAQTTEIRQMNTWRKRWYGAASPAGGVPAG